jgi:ferredoxin/mono/diheme cytochrome c family protein
VPLVVLWFVHLLLTGVIGWALWRHVRKSRHPWLPPHRWSALMGAALLVASIAFPAGMLPPADPARAPGSMPLDPFVMFLLPPLLSPWPWLALLGAGAVAVVAGAFPWFLRRSDPPVVEIVDGSCTGCELCVLDCPYLALTMSGEGDGAVAVVDPAKCVGCGICLGSCSFDAITGLGSPLAAVPDVAGRAVVVGCERHLRQSGENIPASAHLVEVRCTGELNPRAISTLVEQGAVSVQVVGCPPGDCAYGVGNVLTSERLERRRRPFLPRAWEGRVVQDWISPGELLDAISMPGAHPSADKATVPPGGLRVVPVTVVVVLSVLAIRWATDTQYSRIESEPVVRVVVDHASGAVLAAGDGPTGGDAVLTVSVDGVAVLDQHIDGSGGSVAGVFDVPVPLGPAAVEVSLAQGDATAVLYDGAIESESWSRLLVTAFDESPDPLAEQGRQVFTDAQQGGCDVCHSVEVGRALVGPSLAGIAARAADAVPGLDAETYLRQSILQPDAFVVDGYRAGQMLPIYRDRLSDDQLEAVVAYLLTLTEGGS